MSSKFFDFNLPDGSELPEGIVLVNSGGNVYDQLSQFAIQNNRLISTKDAGSSFHGACCGYDSGSLNGVVKATLNLNGQNVASLSVRMKRVYESAYAQVNNLGEVVFIERVSGTNNTLAEGYTIPNFDPAADFELEIHMRGESLELFIAGVSIYKVTQTLPLESTIHGVKGDVGFTADNLSVTDASGLPVVGSAPELLVSGEPYVRLNVGDPIPTFTATATDAEDGPLDITIKGGPIANDATAKYTLEYSVIDSDFNGAVVERVVEYVTKPVLEYHGRTYYRIVQGQPFKPPIAVYIEESGLQGQVYPSGWADGNRNNIGTYTLEYAYLDADPVTVTVEVVERPTITSVGPFSMVQEYGEEYITVDGYELKRFDSPDGETWSYGFENDTVVHGSDIKKPSNETTNTVEVARIKIPFDSLARCDSTTVRVDLQTDNFIDGSRVEVSFGEYRNYPKHRISKNAQSQRTVMEFEIRPYHDSVFKVYGLGNGKDPDTYFQDGYYHDWHLSTDTFLIVYFKFGDITPAANILDVNAQARVGKAKFFEDGEHFLNGKDHLNITPFRPDDPINKKIPPIAAVKSSFLTDNKTDVNAQHFAITAGSDWVTVADTSGIEVGHIPYIVYAFREGGLLSSLRGGNAEPDLVKATLGYAQYVVEVDHANSRFRMTRPAVGDRDSTAFGVDYSERYECVETAHPEIACLKFANDTNSWLTSPINGVDKMDSKNNNNASKTVVLELQNGDPLVDFEFNFILPTNNFIAPFQGDEFEVTTYNERLEKGEWKMPIPDGWDATVSKINNADTNYLFILPNKTYALHMYKTEPKDADGVIKCRRLTGHDLSQWSVSQVQWRPDRQQGATNSSRASGFNAANMVRQAELDKITVRGFTEADIDADLDVAENAIKHALTGYLSAGQLESTNFLEDLSDTTALTPYFKHHPYTYPVKIVDGGSGYARGDTIELTCPVRSDSHTPTVYAVEAVDGSGSILKAIVTRNGQHTIDPSSATQTQYATSGVGVGAVFDTSDMYTQTHTAMNATSYPSAIADGAFLTAYAGAVPMGAVMTIDPRIDLRAEWKAGIMKSLQEGNGIPNGLSYEFYAICCAIKKYGWILCDIAINTFPPIIYEHTILDSSRKDRVIDSPGTSSSYRNTNLLRSLFVPVHNFTPSHHLETDQDLAPVLEYIAGEDITVPPNWRDPKCFALSPLYGDLSDHVTVDKEFDFTTLEPQEFYYSVTDKDGRTSTIGPRRVVVDIPQPLAEAGPSFSLKAGEPFKLQGYGAPSIETIGIDYIEWRQIEGAPTALSDANIGDPTGVAPSAIAAQTLVYELRVVDENGLEATDTMSIEVAALEGRSSVDLSLPDAPDGVFWTVLTDSANRVIFSDALEFVNGVATAEQLPVDGGELIRGTVDSGNTVESPGTGVKGVTYAV
ncbi:MAG: hypothetical protein U9Q87_09075 [Pseudomonadota bacterium]|nr:hypothetical protein [Pseudomonadota bacterium]